MYAINLIMSTGTYKNRLGMDIAKIVKTGEGIEGESLKIGVAYPQTDSEGDLIAVKEIGLATQEISAMTTCWHMTTLLGLSMRVGSLNYGARIRMKTHFTAPFTMFGYLAGVTQKIELVTGVIISAPRGKQHLR